MSMKVLDPAHPEEHDIVYCDWSSIVGPGDAIAAVDTTLIVDQAGVDATPAARLYGNPLLSPPHTVGQWLDGLVVGADYRLCYRITTTSGRRLREYCVLPVRE